jgi:hypothetical protein
MGLKVTRPYINVCGFESKAIPTHGVVENVEVQLKEFPEKTVHIDIIVVDVPDVWGMLLSRKFGAMIGGSLEMDLTFCRIHCCRIHCMIGRIHCCMFCRL